MSLKTNILRSVGGAAAIAVMLVAGAAEAQMGGFKAPSGPQPGDCKRAAEQVLGQNPAHARLIWENTVLAKYGENWSRWPAAQGAAITPVGVGSFVAVGKPCYTHPAG